MSKPQAYDPQHGYQYQILCRSDSRTWEHCDYAVDRADKTHLLKEYRIAYGPSFEFKTIPLPRKYWPNITTGMCKYCQSKIYKNGNTWTDKSGGHVCGADGDNLPHVDQLTADDNTMNIETVLDHYIIAAFWSTNDESNDSGGDPLDDNYDKDDLDPASLDEMRKDVTRFVEANHKMLQTWDHGNTSPEEQAGHDFWLTRNGHGVGFWESEWGAVKDQLSDAAKQFGECYLYVGDDDKIYIN